MSATEEVRRETEELEKNKRPAEFYVESRKASGADQQEPFQRMYLHEELLRGPLHKMLAKEKRPITMAGCGALGSWTSLYLANSGIKNFRLIDKDRVEEHNLSTQFFGKWNLGQSKVQALAVELFRRHNCRVEKHATILSEENVKPLLDNSLLIICTFDNKASREVIKRLILKGIYQPLKRPDLSWGKPQPIDCIMAGMNGKEYYGHVDWAENFVIPEDPIGLEIDPCNYPLSITLATWLSSLITEIAIRYLITAEKKAAKLSMLEIIT